MTNDGNDLNCEPREIVDLGPEVIRLIHAVDKMRDQWSESDDAHRAELWMGVHEACDGVWNRLNFKVAIQPIGKGTES